MKGDPISDQPVHYVSGKVIFHEMFKAEPTFRAVLPLLEGNKQRAQDLGIYLYFMYSPFTTYKHMGEADRHQMTLSGHIMEKEWLVKTMSDPRFKSLVTQYRNVGSSRRSANPIWTAAARSSAKKMRGVLPPARRVLSHAVNSRLVRHSGSPGTHSRRPLC